MEQRAHDEHKSLADKSRNFVPLYPRINSGMLHPTERKSVCRLYLLCQRVALFVIKGKYQHLGLQVHRNISLLWSLSFEKNGTSHWTSQRMVSISNHCSRPFQGSYFGSHTSWAAGLLDFTDWKYVENFLVFHDSSRNRKTAFKASKKGEEYGRMMKNEVVTNDDMRTPNSSSSESKWTVPSSQVTAFLACFSEHPLCRIHLSPWAFRIKLL